MLNEIVRYFDLQSRQRPPKPSKAKLPSGAARMAGADHHHAPVLPQYAAVAAGVLVDPILRSYVDSETFNFDLEPSGESGIRTADGDLIVACGLQECLRPGKAHPRTALALFTSGVGWQSLFQTAATAAS
jgi:hypothetical protein